MSAQPQLDDETLQRLLDGDLNAREAKQARDVLARSEADAARYRSLERLQAVVRTSMDDLVGELDADAMFRAIEDGIAKDRPGALDQLKAWLSEFFEHRSQVWMPLAGAGMVAVVALLTVYSPGGTTPADRTGPAAGSEPAAVVPETGAALNSEVVQVDFGANAGTVFEISMAGGKSTPVVWINDDSGGDI
jgi:anti-sigma factor RsiW